jgi:sulfur carrier protein
MKIILNNREESFEQDQLTIEELLVARNFTFKMLVIKLNGRLLKKPEYQETIVKEGDEVMVLHLVSGG